MSVEMTAPEMIPEGVPPPEEPPKQETPQKAAHKKTWTCSQCGATIDWLPEKVRHLHPSKIRCLKCQKAKKVSEASADAPPPVPPPAPVREAPVRPAPQQRRPARGHNHGAQAPHEFDLRDIELAAYRAGIARSQVEALLAELRSRLTPSSDK